MIWVIALLLAVVVGLYFAIVVYDAYTDTANAPRTNMHICDKHGPIPEKYLYTILEGAEQSDPSKRFVTPEELVDEMIHNPRPATKVSIRACPLCLEDSYKKAKEQLQK